MQDRYPRKRLLTHDLLDVALLLATLKSFIYDIDEAHDEATVQEDVLEEGPFVGLLPTSYFRDRRDFGGARLSLKALSHQQESVSNEYENIMRDIRRRAPAPVLPHSNDTQDTRIALQNRNQENGRMLITMILRAPNEPSGSSGGALNNEGGAMVANRNHDLTQGGAVGGHDLYLNDNFDLFNNLTPATMGEEEINSLLMTNANWSGPDSTSNDGHYPNTRWQQFLLGYNSTMAEDSLSYCSCASQYSGKRDINETVMNAEIFIQPSAQNDLDFFADEDDYQDPTDIFEMTRQQLIVDDEWNIQNPEEDLLFPMLTPPSYEDDVQDVGAEDINSSESRQDVEFNHMHDHNYYDSTSQQNTTTVQQITMPSRGYEIRSRQEVATRVITIPARDEDEGLPYVPNDSNDNTHDETAASQSTVRQSTRTITTGSDSGLEADLDNEIASPVFTQDLDVPITGFNPEDNQYPAASSLYFQDFTKDVGKHRKVIACN